MTAKVTRKLAASANENLRPRAGTGTPLHAVLSPALPAWNRRVHAFEASRG